MTKTVYMSLSKVSITTSCCIIIVILSPEPGSFAKKSRLCFRAIIFSYWSLKQVGLRGSCAAKWLDRKQKVTLHARNLVPFINLCSKVHINGNQFHL